MAPFTPGDFFSTPIPTRARARADNLANYRMPDGSKAHFEILGQGQQFVAFGTHPNTMRPYRWLDGSPETVPLAALAVITDMQPRDFVGEAETILIAAGGVIIEPPKQPRDPAPSRPRLIGGGDADGFFHKVNAKALEDIAAWGAALHPDFRDRDNSGWRVTSKDLGRGRRLRRGHRDPPDRDKGLGHARPSHRNRPCDPAQRGLRRP